MSEQQPEDIKETVVPAKVEEVKKSSSAETPLVTVEEVGSASADDLPKVPDTRLAELGPQDAVVLSNPEEEWIPGEHLELIKIPPPTIWPATLALGTTGIAFGVVTHWILSVAGLFLFLLGAAGWIEDLRKDVL